MLGHENHGTISIYPQFLDETKRNSTPVTFFSSDKLKTSRIKKALISQGLRSGAGDGDRTHDLMLGKHTL